MADEKLTGLQKSAILLIALGPERSATIFKHLKEEEIEELTHLRDSLLPMLMNGQVTVE